MSIQPVNATNTFKNSVYQIFIYNNFWSKKYT